MTLLPAAAALIAAVSLAGCSAPAPEPEELTVSAAGARYLEAVCPVNAAWDGVDVELDRVKLLVSRGEQPDTAGVAAALDKLGAESLAAAEILDDPAVAWPAAAADSIAGVRETLTADAEQAAAVATLGAAELAGYRWEGSGEIATSAADTRAALGLPDDTRDACEEVLARAEAKEPADTAG